MMGRLSLSKMAWHLSTAMVFCFLLGTMAIAQQNSEFFSPIEAGRDIDNYELSKLIKDFQKAATSRGKLTYIQNFMRTNSAYDGMKKVGLSKKVAPKDGTAARKALASVKDDRGARALIEIASEGTAPKEFRLEAHSGIQQHATRGSKVAIEFLERSQSDTALPIYLRDASSEFLAKKELPPMVRDVADNSRRNADSAKSQAAANAKLRKELFSEIHGHHDWSNEKLEVIINEFAVHQDYRIGPAPFYARYLQSDEAFEAMGVIASNTEIESQHVKAARDALVKINDERTVSVLCKVVANPDLPEPLHVQLHQAILSKILQGSAGVEKALKYFETTLADPDLSEGLTQANRSFVDSIGSGMHPTSLRSLSKSQNAEVTERAKGELARLEAVDARLTVDDASVLEGFKRERVGYIEAEIERNEKRADELRKAKNGGNTAAAINSMAGVRKQMQKFLSEFKKRPVFELAVDDFAAYCKEAQDGARFTQLTADELNQDAAAKRALASSMPVFEVTEYYVDRAGNEIPMTRETSEVDTGLLVDFADMLAWDARVKANAAAMRAREIQRRLVNLSDGALLEIKVAYIERLSAASKRTR